MSRTLMLAAGCLSLGFAAGPFAASQSRMIVTPIESAAFKPVDPARPNSAQVAVLRGDPNSGPSSTLLRLAKGPTPLHVHSSDYDLVVISGEMKHWERGQSEAQAAVLGPGSYYFQPGDLVHAGACLTDECLMYVQWSGRRDGRVPDAQ